VNRETLKRLIEDTNDIQRRMIRLGARIQLTAYHEPDHPDVEVIPDDIEEIKYMLDELRVNLDDTVFGGYEVVWYKYTEGDPEPMWHNATPSGYKLAKLRADTLNRLSNTGQGYFQPVSVDDLSKDFPQLRLEK
jgi:hypothetical protein